MTRAALAIAATILLAGCGTHRCDPGDLACARALFPSPTPSAR